MAANSLALAGLCTLVLSLACGSEPQAAPSPTCAPGSAAPCTCEPGALPGTQQCGADGKLGACECTVAEAPAPAPEPAPPEPAPPSAEEVAAQAGTITPEAGVYEVTIARQGQCLSLSGPARKLPDTTRTQRWRIKVSGPNTLTIHDGHKEHKATLTNGEYVFDRRSELGRALIRLSFAADGVRGTGTASAVTHRGHNRRTAEDCGETLTITGRKA